MTVVVGPNLKVLRVLSLVSRVACPSIDLVCFLNVFGLGAVAFFFQRQWQANGRMGKVVGDSFHFCLS